MTENLQRKTIECMYHSETEKILKDLSERYISIEKILYDNTKQLGHLTACIEEHSRAINGLREEIYGNHKKGLKNQVNLITTVAAGGFSVFLVVLTALLNKLMRLW